MPIIAPSFLASDFLHLAGQCELINNSVAEWVHLDVMDGRFVPNISFGVPVIKPVCKATPGKYHDVHLMIEEPEKYVEDFKSAGANSITVHYEACRHLHRNIEQIKKLGIHAGVALNPHTPVELLQDVLPYLDLVLVMSVNPGFGGQQFIEHSIEKIKRLRRMIDEKAYTALIEVDGGITLDNAAAVVNAGADVLVAGSSIFGADDIVATIGQFKAV
ncbi:ribulose-phosphate 3-epimerase [Ilyomonas limi]|uniref:Ribulose-phosphate 3-epimerase n=1 Tax=Ilyomonas limi TaxID=2575867 RepID=A0A4U3L8H4_9BACT|nr:ribulose-phosphate 3-epimerase [Ilyomonas limi]TKK70206.1 ribulose-phosphate 3-epimerase [Ilyomonas limi]